jgi:hypothetical protein
MMQQPFMPSVGPSMPMGMPMMPMPVSGMTMNPMLQQLKQANIGPKSSLTEECSIHKGSKVLFELC